jgi:hypothetical protein
MDPNILGVIGLNDNFDFAAFRGQNSGRDVNVSDVDLG